MALIISTLRQAVMGAPVDHLPVARSYCLFFANASATRSSAAALCCQGHLSGWVSWNNGGNGKCLFKIGLLRKRFPAFIVRTSSLASFRNDFDTCQANMVKESKLNGAFKVSKPDTTIQEQLENCHIFLMNYSLGQQNRGSCPKCQGGSSREKSLSVYISRDGKHAYWNCHRGKCGWKDSVGVSGCSTMYSNVRDPEVMLEFTEEKLCFEPLFGEVKNYLHLRGITQDTLHRNGVNQVVVNGQYLIAFPYKQKGKIVNCKYRGITEYSWQEMNTRKIYYGVDDIQNAEEIIIVEGEIDKLSMEEAGFLNCVSVPDGTLAMFPEKGSCFRTEDQKYAYIWNCKEYFNKASRIILATDADAPGQALAEELARRLGRERCWRVNWPTIDGIRKCKDANEVLQILGKQSLRDMIASAEMYPIRGLFRFCDFDKEIDEYYSLTIGDEFGVSSGWRNLDKLYRVVPGELTIVTGVPNSGKSEWIDALLCNLNSSHGWTFGLCSMENKVHEHGRKLLEKFVGKPFFDAPYAQSIPRMDEMEFEAGKQWLDQNFFLIRCENDQLPSIDWVLGLAKSAVMRYGIRGLVIDPYNELDHQRSSNQTETEYVSCVLTKIKRFAQHYDCHVWFVAHPRQVW
eukprot:c22354_g1_i1 orf=469-2352(+)